MPSMFLFVISIFINFFELFVAVFQAFVLIFLNLCYLEDGAVESS